ncbi:FecR family protein [Polaromonas aquatica]|uniref:FecR family protein n=1 Tax=Polaromonas aquatica TaxID=332657 RepID=UPI003D65C9F6
MKHRYLTALAGLALAAVQATAQTQTEPAAAGPVAPAATPAPAAEASAAPASVPLPPPPPAPGQAGFLKTLRGDVKLMEASGAARPAKAGDAVLPTGRIVTGAGSAASLVLRDGTTVVVGPASQLDIKGFSFDATTQEGGLLLSLLQGSLRMMSGLVGKAHPETVRIETKTAFVGIRGTDFIVQADPQP